MEKISRALLPVLLCFSLVLCSSLADAEEIPVKNSVTLVDLGADSCIPCKMMAPIIDRLQEEYKGRAAIIFIDVWKKPEKGRKFGIRAIPTQIIYDKSGRERYRHVGFMPEKDLRKWLDDLLAL